MAIESFEIQKLQNQSGASRLETVRAPGGNAGTQSVLSGADLSEEAHNMLELMSRQLTSISALSLSSKETRTVLSRF